MVFVNRENGEVAGVFTVPQPGFAEEELPAGHPEVVTFRERADNAPQRDLAAELDAVKTALIKKGTITEQEIEAERGDRERLDQG